MDCNTFMDNNNNIIINMEPPLDKQLAILKLARKHYISLINKNKLYCKHNLSSFIDKPVNIVGLCSCVQTAIYTSINTLISYDVLDSYIPIFNPIKVNEIIKQSKRRYRLASTTDKYWYDTSYFRIRINIMNLLIQHLQLKIKENGKNLCNA